MGGRGKIGQGALSDSAMASSWPCMVSVYVEMPGYVWYVGVGYLQLRTVIYGARLKT